MLERLKEIWLDAKQMRDERGLTLIELLVVVVILGIIAAIAVVAIGGLIENSRKDAQVSNAKQLLSAAKLYTSQNSLESGEVVQLGLVKASTDIVDTATKGNATTPRMGNLDKFVDSLKDPMDGDAKYADAYVQVTELNGKYVYKVYLVGSKSYFNGDGPGGLKRAGISSNTVTP